MYRRRKGKEGRENLVLAITSDLVENKKKRKLLGGSPRCLEVGAVGLQT